MRRRWQEGANNLSAHRNNIGITSKTVMMEDDYDSPWKEAIEHYFSEFMAFYFPDAFAEIDWSKEYVFLEQELHAVVQDAELGKRFVDKLVRVSLRNGDEKWIYIHIEVQGSRQNEFAKRMFVYNYRIYDRYERPVASMAVLADENANWKPFSYGFEALGCKHTLEFPVAKLTDYHDRLNKLLAADNPFALVTAAHILTQQTRNDDNERYKAKQLLVRLLYRRNWGKQQVIDLFSVIDWMMRLPDGLEQQLWQEIATIEESEKMQYITSVERIGIAKGREEGREEGRGEGVLEGEAKMLGIMLKHRFGDLADASLDKLMHASEEQLKQWLIDALSAPNLDAVFKDGKTH